MEPLRESKVCDLRTVPRSWIFSLLLAVTVRTKAERSGMSLLGLIPISIELRAGHGVMLRGQVKVLEGVPSMGVSQLHLCDGPMTLVFWQLLHKQRQR